MLCSVVLVSKVDRLGFIMYMTIGKEFVWNDKITMCNSRISICTHIIYVNISDRNYLFCWHIKEERTSAASMVSVESGSDDCRGCCRCSTKDRFDDVESVPEVSVFLTLVRFFGLLCTKCASGTEFLFLPDCELGGGIFLVMASPLPAW